jgi:hypothetical protein
MGFIIVQQNHEAKLPQQLLGGQQAVTTISGKSRPTSSVVSRSAKQRSFSKRLTTKQSWGNTFPTSHIQTAKKSAAEMTH